MNHHGHERGIGLAVAAMGFAASFALLVYFVAHCNTTGATVGGALLLLLVAKHVGVLAAVGGSGRYLWLRLRQVFRKQN